VPARHGVPASRRGAAGCDAICPAYGAPARRAAASTTRPTSRRSRGLLPPRARADARAEKLQSSTTSRTSGSNGKNIFHRRPSRNAGRGQATSFSNSGRPRHAVRPGDRRVAALLRMLLKDARTRRRPGSRAGSAASARWARHGVGAGGRVGDGVKPGPKTRRCGGQHGRRVAPVAHPARVLPRGPMRSA